MKIAIIGAGVAGLSALKHSLDDGHECVVLERNDYIGGIWKYVEKTGIDQFGLPVHSSMYEHLRTNIPKELMQLDEFRYNGDINYSYLRHEEVLSYIHSYADAYNLWPYIKLMTYVIEISPLPRNRWSIKFKDLKRNIEEEEEFDSFIVCIGNYSTPFVPKLQGLDKFKGSAIHSHDYRKISPYRNKKILIVGAGFSGIDIAKAIAPSAKSVVLSHRGPVRIKLELSKNMFLKPEIQQFRSNSVVFKDGSEYDVDDVILCTGYLNSFPFLSPKCGITVNNNCISSLYKYIINVEHPTMAFIGLPRHIPMFPLVSLQVRFFLAYLRGKFKMSKENMLIDIEKYKEISKTLGKSMDHDLARNHRDYVEDLENTAKVNCFPLALNKMYDYVINEKFQIFNLSYRVVDDENFESYECLC